MKLYIEIIYLKNTSILRCRGHEITQQRFCLSSQCPESRRNLQRGQRGSSVQGSGDPGTAQDDDVIRAGDKTSQLSYKDVAINTTITSDICYPLERFLSILTEYRI